MKAAHECLPNQVEPVVHEHVWQSPELYRHEAVLAIFGPGSHSFRTPKGALTEIASVLCTQQKQQSELPA